jgi:hypothetical protein
MAVVACCLSGHGTMRLCAAWHSVRRLRLMSHMVLVA